MHPKADSAGYVPGLLRGSCCGRLALELTIKIHTCKKQMRMCGVPSVVGTGLGRPPTIGLCRFFKRP
jgi:hypothetical protein